MSLAGAAQAGYSDATRAAPDAATRHDARLVAAVIAGMPGLSAQSIAARINAEAGLFGGARRFDARLVRRLVWVARRFLGAPIIARPGGEDASGYRLCRTMAEAAGYAERCRRLGRDYFALAAIVLGRADLAVGEQFSLDEIAAVAPTAEEWDAMHARLRERLGAGGQ